MHHDPDLAPGTYAVSIFHDENRNGKLDTDWLGRPKEGLGFSNNARGRRGPPKFDDAKFDLGARARPSRSASSTCKGQRHELKVWACGPECTTLIGQVESGAAASPPRCAQQMWRLGGRGLLLSSQGRWRADCELRRRDRLRLHCLVDEPFLKLGVKLTADAEKQ